jgi:hypothetical protein
MGALESVCEPRRQTVMEEVQGQSSRSLGRDDKEHIAASKSTDALAWGRKQLQGAISPRQVTFADESEGSKQAQWDVGALCQCSEPERQQLVEIERQERADSVQQRADPRIEAEAARRRMQQREGTPEVEEKDGERVNEDGSQEQKLTTPIEIARAIRQAQKAQDRLSEERSHGWKKQWHAAESQKKRLKAQLAEIQEVEEMMAKKSIQRPPVKFSCQKTEDEPSLGNVSFKGSFKGTQRIARTKSWTQAAMFKESNNARVTSS